MIQIMISQMFFGGCVGAACAWYLSGDFVPAAMVSVLALAAWLFACATYIRNATEPAQ